MDSEYRERIMLPGGVPVSETERLVLVHFFSIWLNVKNSADVTRSFYELVRQSLVNEINVPDESDIDIMAISEMIGLVEMSDPDEVFVIWEFSHGVFKIKWEMLKKAWENIWRSPADDAVILYIPNKKILLVTHWDVIYYS
jgi:hypothetical protein